MVSSISSVSSSVSMSDEIANEIQEALQMIYDAKKKDAKSTSDQIIALLIDYVIANTKGDKTEVKAIQGQMEQVIQKYGSDIENANNLTAKLKAMDPSTNTASEHAFLQSLIAALRGDVTSGDLSNLAQFV